MLSLRAAGTCRDVETACTASCWVALDKMQRNKRKMLPIVNADGELVSALTTSDDCD